jgi:hypothetical protein
MSKSWYSIVSAEHSVSGNKSGVILKALVIDITNASDAPSGERIGINYYPHDPHPAIANFLLSLFSGSQPRLIRAGQITITAEDFDHSVEILSPVIPNERNHAHA